MGKKKVSVSRYGVHLGQPIRECLRYAVEYKSNPPSNKKVLISIIEFDARYTGIYPREVLTLTFSDSFKASVTQDYGRRELRDSWGLTEYSRSRSLERIKLVNNRDPGAMSDILDQLGKRSQRAKSLLEKALQTKLKKRR